MKITGKHPCKVLWPVCVCLVWFGLSSTPSLLQHLSKSRMASVLHLLSHLFLAPQNLFWAESLLTHWPKLIFCVIQLTKIDINWVTSELKLTQSDKNSTCLFYQTNAFLPHLHPHTMVLTFLSPHYSSTYSTAINKLCSQWSVLPSLLQHPVLLHPTAQAVGPC